MSEHIFAVLKPKKLSCDVEGCTGSHFAKGYCNIHYQRQRAHGTTDRSQFKQGLPAGHWAWTTYYNMLSRCYKQTDKRYASYGGRGIKIGERWLGDYGMKRFVEDMGPKPSPEHSIDRIDVNGNYEPSNCRWATPREQARNRRVVNDTPGVSWHKASGKWRARLKINNKEVYLGIFDGKSEAIAAVKRAEVA